MSFIEPYRLIKVENQDGLFRDKVSNSILFEHNNPQESRKKFLLDVLEKIKNIENILNNIEHRISKLENPKD
jgi:hypothetical protein